MSFIDESSRSILLRESGDDHLHPFGEFIDRILEIIRDGRIHLHSRFDNCIILITTDDIREPEGVIMDTELFIRPIEELLTKYRREVGDGRLSIIDEGCNIESSSEFDIIREVTEFFPTLERDRLITEPHHLSHEEGIFFDSFGIRFLDPGLELRTSDSRELFMHDSSEGIDFCCGDDMDLGIHPTEEGSLRLCIDLISIEFQSWY